MAIEQNTTGYCILADVTGLTGKSYTSATMPTSSQVESFIMERADLINGVLGALGFSVPIPATATRSSRVLLALNARGAAADAEVSVPGLLDEPPRARVWREEFGERLEAIRRRALDLPDATASSDTPTTVDNRTPAGAFNLDTDSVERDPVFDRDTDL